MGQKSKKIDKAGVLEFLKEHALVLKLSESNPFKIRAIEKARDVLKKETSDWLSQIEQKKLTQLPGIGKGIEALLTELYRTGRSKEHQELKQTLPKGLMELVQLPGLGPKKAKELVDQLGVRTIGELEYACRENRLTSLKGFGDKMQTKVLKAIEFQKSTQGQHLWVEIQWLCKQLLSELQKSRGADRRVEVVGPFQRKVEVIDCLQFLLEVHSDEDTEALDRKLKKKIESILKRAGIQTKVELFYSLRSEFGTRQVRLTSSEVHWKSLKAPKTVKASTEKTFYQKLSLEWIPPECRETGEEINFARKQNLDDSLVGWNDVQGVFHNHTTFSDGSATLEQMVKRARDLGFQYIGISDHSQTAFYANGLKKDQIEKQHREVETLREKYPDITIFWGIESDILKDGALDYPSGILKKFDFVIASIHQRFKLDRKEMTARLLKAIENPHTRFVGHISGRLILGRPPYDLDMEALIQAASKHNTAIEINANPRRLDIDWRYGSIMRKHRLLTSINPDAHSLEGLEDTIHGITVARKALLPKKNVISTWSRKEVGDWLKQKN